ncbi:MAG: GIY-YIG nuclease family protein, partial [Gammaproteobacteria bacterium]
MAEFDPTAFLKTAPKRPGVYRMLDAEGTVIYVGKAKELNKRVSSYFNNSAKTPKTEILVGHIRDFDFM